MNTNLTIRMGQMQELKESMNFLDRMRGIITDEEYTSRAKKLMACLPDPETYTTEVTSTKELVMAIKTESIETETIEEDENDSIIEYAIKLVTTRFNIILLSSDASIVHLTRFRIPHIKGRCCIK
jgi:hypothetical protein